MQEILTELILSLVIFFSHTFVSRKIEGKLYWICQHSCLWKHYLHMWSNVSPIYMILLCNILSLVFKRGINLLTTYFLLYFLTGLALSNKKCYSMTLFYIMDGKEMSFFIVNLYVTLETLYLKYVLKHYSFEQEILERFK